MLNNKGQSLVMFIIVLPLLLIILGTTIEYSLLTYNKNKIASVTKTIIANCIDRCEKDDIILLYNKNDIKVDNVAIDVSDGLQINLKTSVNSYFGNIIGKESYDINIKIKGYLKKEKIYYEKG